MSVLSSAVGSGTTAIAFALVGFSKFCAHGAGNTMSRDSEKVGHTRNFGLHQFA